MIEVSPVHLVETYGLWAVFAAALLESMGLPVPSEGVLIAAAVVAGSHAQPSVAGLILAAGSGGALGACVAYWIGSRAGAPLLRRFGGRIGLDAARLRLGRYLFGRYGGRIVFLGRFVAVLRTLSPLLAGVNRMPFGRFLAANLAGALAWAATIGLSAYGLGAHVHEVSRPVLAAGSALAVGVVVAIGVVLKRQERRLQAEADRAFPDEAGPPGVGEV